MKKILNLLKNNSDLKYKNFSSSLIPNIDSNLILGVRIPVIRKLYKQMTKEEIDSFINDLPHCYLEENILHAIILSNIKDFDKCILELDRFLPYVDNWSVCDTLICKSLNFDLNKTFNFLIKCLKSNDIYRIRFVFVTMLRYFVNDQYIDICNSIAVNYNSEEYYINMAIAWYFSYALIYQYEKTIKIFDEKKLSKWIHNKSIQKAIESYRITEERKKYLRGLRIK